LDQIERVLSLGAGRVILGTIAVEEPDVVEQAAKKYADAIVVGIDARKGKVASRGWVEQTSLSAIDLATMMRSRGIVRVIYTDVSRDGMLSGINVSETEDLARKAEIRVIASGGVAGFDDIRQLWQRRASGIEGVILGRALYDGKLDLREAIRKLKELYAGQENHSLP
jgi:phosphoribosylformimino-5-aminoimidazole carboxamide ribotide isomerase